jgi:hypothetical protein
MAAHYSDRDQRLRASVVHAGYVTPVDITLVTLGEGERRFFMFAYRTKNRSQKI